MSERKVSVVVSGAFRWSHIIIYTLFLSHAISIVSTVCFFIQMFDSRHTLIFEKRNMSNEFVGSFTLHQSWVSNQYAIYFCRQKAIANASKVISTTSSLCLCSLHNNNISLTAAIRNIVHPSHIHIYNLFALVRNSPPISAYTKNPKWRLDWYLCMYN